MGIVLQYRFLHHPVRKNYTTEITWPCRRCLCSIRPVCGAFSFSQAPLFQGFGSLRPPSFCQYNIPRQSVAVTESRRRFCRCVLQGSSRLRNLSASIGSRLCGLRWLKIFLSLFPSWNFLFAWPQSYLHQLLSNGYEISPSTFHGKKADRVQPKIFIPTLIQRKKSHGLQPKSSLTCPKEKLYLAMRWKFIPSLFMPKNRVFWHLKNWEFTKCSKFRELSVKRKQAKDGETLCLLQSTFSKQKQDRAIPFPIIVFLLRL